MVRAVQVWEGDGFEETMVEFTLNVIGVRGTRQVMIDTRTVKRLDEGESGMDILIQMKHGLRIAKCVSFYSPGKNVIYANSVVRP